MDKIQEQIQYWINYTGHGDNYRKKNDRDCILTQGNLYADTLISLWLPLRYVIFECNKENESFDSSEISKKDKKFLESLKDNLTKYIPDEKAIEKLNTLFDLGMTRANVIILPYRRWNSIRGGSPYWDYMPHFLYDLLNVQDERFEAAVKSWIRREQLTMFFEGELKKENLRDLCGTGNVCMHNPASEKFNTNLLIDNYIAILKERQKVVKED